MRVLTLVIVLLLIALASSSHAAEVGAAEEACGPESALVPWQAPAPMALIELPALTVEQQLLAAPGESMARPDRGCERVSPGLSSWSPGFAALVGSARCFEKAFNNYIGTDFAAYGVFLSPNHITLGLPTSAGTFAHRLELSCDTKQRMMLKFRIKDF